MTDRHGGTAAGDGRGDELADALLATVPPARRTTLRPAVETLLACERRRWLARAEEIWLRRFGWSLMRPLLATGAGAATLLLLWNREQAAVLLAPLVLGAAAFYAVLQVYVHRWLGQAARRERDAAGERAAAVKRLRQLAGSPDRDG